jgi:peptidoglycan hydrolase-like protein with peptidoglycan-binding domain
MAHGYYEGAIDGHLGIGTKSALKAYQADSGIKVDGTLSTPTLNGLGISGGN